MGNARLEGVHCRERMTCKGGRRGKKKTRLGVYSGRALDANIYQQCMKTKTPGESLRIFFSLFFLVAYGHCT